MRKQARRSLAKRGFHLVIAKKAETSNEFPDARLTASGPRHGAAGRISRFVEEKTHIQRRRQDPVATANIVIAQFDTLIDVVFLRMV